MFYQSLIFQDRVRRRVPHMGSDSAAVALLDEIDGPMARPACQGLRVSKVQPARIQEFIRHWSDGRAGELALTGNCRSSRSRRMADINLSPSRNSRRSTRPDIRLTHFDPHGSCLWTRSSLARHRPNAWRSQLWTAMARMVLLRRLLFGRRGFVVHGYDA